MSGLKIANENASFEHIFFVDLSLSDSPILV